MVSRHKFFSKTRCFNVTFYMQVAGIAIVKEAPFLRLLFPFITGIMLQWHFHLPPISLIIACILAALYLLCSFRLPAIKKFSLGWVNGLVIAMALAATGALLAWLHDIRNNQKWIGHHYNEQQWLAVSLEENLVTKKKSYKANARVQYLVLKDSVQPVTGKLIIYFKKDSAASGLSYGSTLLIKKPLQRIKNAGNPGSFDYQRFCLFNDITHQVFLQQNDFVSLQEKSVSAAGQFLINARLWVIGILRQHINGDKEKGLAEALLIGYKDDLDMNLVQAYTNTGVVHIIAISGLHLGMIYFILVILLKSLKKKKNTRWLFALAVIGCLWLFSLMAGGQPSVLRSALMFTCIVIGETLSRKTSIYNSLAFSAFVLLCINPFYLWDVGFQLSYAAVLSIVLFMRPIYNLIYVKNKVLDFFWQLNAVTLAAQVLTIPISVYHFHQFPNLFLLSNLVAVPLSGLILYGLILVCAFSIVPAIAHATGYIITKLIGLLNAYIEHINNMPFAVWDGLQISIWQTIFLFLFIAGSMQWLMKKNKTSLAGALLALILFYLSAAVSYFQAHLQQKLIVYNVPGKRAIDFIQGQQAFFTGNSEMLNDEFLHNFHLKPARTLLRIKQVYNDTAAKESNHYFLYGNKKIGILTYPPKSKSSSPQQQMDLAIITGKNFKNLEELISRYHTAKLVFDGSVPAYQYRRWQKILEQKNIPHHYVVEKGAFVFNPK